MFTRDLGLMRLGEEPQHTRGSVGLHTGVAQLTSAASRHLSCGSQALGAQPRGAGARSPAHSRIASNRRADSQQWDEQGGWSNSLLLR